MLRQVDSDPLAKTHRSHVFTLHPAGAAVGAVRQKNFVPAPIGDLTCAPYEEDESLIDGIECGDASRSARISRMIEYLEVPAR